MDRQTEQVRWRRGRAAAAVLAAAVLLIGDGCNRVQQFDPAHRRLLEQLRTAVSARRSDWVDATARVANKQHDSNQLSDTEYAAVITIIEMTHAGQWAEANKAALELERGQGGVAPAARTTRSGRHAAGAS